MDKNKIKLLISVLLLTVMLCGCNERTEVYEAEGFVMSTYLRQQLYGEKSKEAATQVTEYFDSLEEKLSLFSDKSEIQKINNSAGINPVKVSSDTFEILSAAMEFSEASNGIFDISVAPLTLLWGIDTEKAALPNKADISALLPLVDYNSIVLDNTNKTVFLKKSGMQLDLGGIAKGYAAKKVAEIYKSQGLSGGLCSIGGNIFVYGEKPGNKQFTLGIRTPETAPKEQLLGKLEVNNTTISTAGGYERYFEENGKLYHHILDTKTGYPSESDLLSVTVVADNGARADALSTTLFLAGSSAIQQYLTDERFSVIVVDKEKKVYVSPSISKSFTLTNTEYTLA